ncbi:MAG: hypothetical protein ISR65_00255 [Bacteriovoracaceae bacterium]|nr:hypothetical protein [Bacteriovoracaceae bacterium]
MKLEFEQNIIPTHLFDELGFEEFLANFDIPLPIISKVILKPLSCTQGESHFSELTKLRKQFKDNLHSLENIINLSSRLNSLDEVCTAYNNQSLDQVHLYTLAQFIKIDLEIQAEEKKFFQAHNPCLQIQTVLGQYMGANFNKLLLSQKETNIQEVTTNLEQDLLKEIKKIENEINKQTTLSMIYPYPKEISKQSSLFPSIKTCKLLQVKEDLDCFLVTYNLPAAMEELVKKIEGYQTEFNKLIDLKLTECNKHLHEYLLDFKKYYDLRKKRTYNYALVTCLLKNKLVIPSFDNVMDFKICEGELPQLKKKAKKHYAPLTISFKGGSNILFGSNMSGKTTILKTLYFHLTLIKMGLPVPAKKLNLKFPKHVGFHLMSSGDIRTNLSSLGDELNFFTQAIPSSSYILIDELFHSTNPVAGVELSKIFIKEFSKKPEVIFFCNTHYPEIISQKNSAIFKTSDSTPYIPELVASDNLEVVLKDNYKPLELALSFAIPESIKKEIKKYLENK